MKKNKVAAIVDHQVERRGRQDDGSRVMLAAIRDDADIRPPHIRP